MDCPFSPQLRAFVRVFTASPMDLQRYASLGDSKLRDVLADMQWDQTDTKALDFLEKRSNNLSHYRQSLSFCGDAPLILGTLYLHVPS